MASAAESLHALRPSTLSQCQHCHKRRTSAAQVSTLPITADTLYIHHYMHSAPHTDHACHELTAQQQDKLLPRSSWPAAATLSTGREHTQITGSHIWALLYPCIRDRDAARQFLWQSLMARKHINVQQTHQRGNSSTIAAAIFCCIFFFESRVNLG